MAERDLRRALEDDLEQIEDNTRLYKAGRDSAYQAVAIQLRNLLLKGRRGLVLRVLPNATFHSLSGDPEGFAEADRPGEFTAFRFSARGGSLKLGGGYPGAQLELVFDGPLVPLEKWLDQWVISPGITLRQLIEATANDEVAHTEDEVRDVHRQANFLTFAGRPRNRRMHALAIVALGEYVAARVRGLLQG